MFPPDGAAGVTCAPVVDAVGAFVSCRAGEADMASLFRALFLSGGSMMRLFSM